MYEASGIGDLEQYKQIIHSDKSIGLFLCELFGLEWGAAEEAFAGYIDESKFNAQQIQFVNIIIDYLTQNGVMSLAQLAKPPFSDQHFDCVFGLFDDAAEMSLRNQIKSGKWLGLNINPFLYFLIKTWLILIFSQIVMGVLVKLFSISLK